jgi:imidazoleglycerol-phosphate dehydratase
MSRTARLERETKESKVLVEINLDGSGRTEISTGVGFYDHMLTAFGRHGLSRPTVIPTSMPTTRSRTPRSCSAMP